MTSAICATALATGLVLCGCGSEETDAPEMAAAPSTPGAAGAGGAVSPEGSTGGSSEPGAPSGVSPSGSSNETVAVGGLNGEPGTGSGDGSAPDEGAPVSTPAPLIPGTERYDCSPPTGTLPPLQLAPFVTGLNNPVFVTHAPGEVDRLFVLEQQGRILVLRNGAVNEAPFLDLTDEVELLTWEQGLLGLAFHPQYAENGLFYVHYNGEAGAAVISELRVSSEPDVADPASERVLLTVPTVDGYHNGGSINFGPDSLLYIGLGDGGGLGAAAGPSRLNAQDVTSLRGGMLRISPVPDGMSPYTSPPGNLIDVNPQARPELWSKGLRNPYRFNFDPCTGAMYIGDVGDRSWEEVNVEPPATGHRNYGWPILEGNECFGGAAAGDCDRTGMTPPVHTHPSANTGGPQFQAVIGGAVYRGSAIPALRGTYFFTDLYGNTRTFRYDVATDTIGEVVSLERDLNPAENDQGLVAIQNGGDGELYFVSRGSSGGGGAFAPQEPIGAIYRLEAE